MAPAFVEAAQKTVSFLLNTISDCVQSKTFLRAIFQQPAISSTHVLTRPPSPDPGHSKSNIDVAMQLLADLEMTMAQRNGTIYTYIYTYTCKDTYTHIHMHITQLPSLKYISN